MCTLKLSSVLQAAHGVEKYVWACVSLSLSRLLGGEVKARGCLVRPINCKASAIAAGHGYLSLSINSEPNACGGFVRECFSCRKSIVSS